MPSVGVIRHRDVRHPARDAVVVGEAVVRNEPQAAPLVGDGQGLRPAGECPGLTEQRGRRFLGARDRHDLDEVGIVDEVHHSDPEAKSLHDPVGDRLQRGGEVESAVDPHDEPLQVPDGGQAEVAHLFVDLR